jgi:hypothetical protein
MTAPPSRPPTTRQPPTSGSGPTWPTSSCPPPPRRRHPRRRPRPAPAPVLYALERLLGTEVAAAERRKLASRLRLAALPTPWTLDDYDFSAQLGADEKLIRELASGDDLRSARVKGALVKRALDLLVPLPDRRDVLAHRGLVQLVAELGIDGGGRPQRDRRPGQPGPERPARTLARHRSRLCSRLW